MGNPDLYEAQSSKNCSTQGKTSLKPLKRAFEGVFDALYEPKSVKIAPVRSKKVSTPGTRTNHPARYSTGIELQFIPNRRFWLLYRQLRKQSRSSPTPASTSSAPSSIYNSPEHSHQLFREQNPLVRHRNNERKQQPPNDQGSGAESWHMVACGALQCSLLNIRPLSQTALSRDAGCYGEWA